MASPTEGSTSIGRYTALANGQKMKRDTACQKHRQCGSKLAKNPTVPLTIVQSAGMENVSAPRAEIVIQTCPGHRTKVNESNGLRLFGAFSRNAADELPMKAKPF